MKYEEFDELSRLIHGYEELTDAKSLFRKLSFIDAWIVGTMRFQKLKDLQDFELKEEMKKFEQGFTYKAPQKNSEWINVEARLPPDIGPYLFYLEDGSMCVAKKSKEVSIDDLFLVGGWENCRYCQGYNEITFNSPDKNQKRATHWKELPNSP